MTDIKLLFASISLLAIMGLSGGVHAQEFSALQAGPSLADIQMMQSSHSIGVSGNQAMNAAPQTMAMAAANMSSSTDAPLAPEGVLTSTASNSAPAVKSLPVVAVDHGMDRDMMIMSQAAARTSTRNGNAQVASAAQNPILELRTYVSDR